MTKRKAVLFSVVAALLFFGALEVGLRLVGFQVESGPRYMEFNYPDPHTLYEIFEPDPDTLWRLKPGVSMGPSIEPLSVSGFRGEAFSTAKIPGVKRVVCVGDSLTFGAEETYPRALGECLGGGYEVINMGAPGYSSLQGLKVYRSRAAALMPDIVVFMFGWNDHWLAKGRTDAEQFAKRVKAPPRFVDNSRVFSLVAAIVDNLSADGAAPRRPRVSLDEYRENLRAFVRESSLAGSKTILMTSPSAISMGKLPDFIISLGFIEGDPSEPAAVVLKRLGDLHASYNNVVRSVANETGATLVDLDKMWSERGVADLYRDPSNDLTHPNPDGYRLIGKILCDTIQGTKIPQ